MAEELEKNTQDSSAQPKQSSDASREGYRPQQGYQRDYVNGRVQRPRIHTQRTFSSDKSALQQFHLLHGVSPQ